MPSTHPSHHPTDLAQLGLSTELFDDVVEYATAQARACSEYDGPAMAGTTFWSRSNRRLAEILTNKKKTNPPWKYTRRDSILRSVHPSGSHAITAMSGHGGVGNPNAKIRAKNPKGRAMAHLVENNAKFEEQTGQGVFYSNDDLEFGRELDDIPLWFFLYERGKNGLLAAELCLPVKMNGKFVNEWSTRITVFTDKTDPGIDVSLLDKAEETTTEVSVNLNQNQA
ncbi:hypothetical protein [Streptomyces tubercidicus]|uniref:hypothetical protein n=1 Tax=Streptomyces tubercidicus TaxID=47759 RepID=UPI0034674C2A